MNVGTDEVLLNLVLEIFAAPQSAAATTHTCACAHTHTYTCVRAHTHTHTHTCMRVTVCIRICADEMLNLVLKIFTAHKSTVATIPAHV